MPSITRQQPNSKKQAPSNNSSILSSAIDVQELAGTYIKLVVYGQNRVGKTTLACTFPKPLLLISFEPNRTGGALSVVNVPGVKFIRITSSKQSLQLADELKQDTTFKTHVLDTATSYQDIILQELMDLPSVPEQLDWGTVSQDIYRQRSEKTKEALRPFLNLPAHTVICAKERDHNPPKEERNKLIRGMKVESYFASDLGGATVGWLHDACDYIGRLYLDKEVKKQEVKVPASGGKFTTRIVEEETGKIVHRLRTMYHPNFAAGFRAPVGREVPEHIENPTFDSIYKVIKG